MPHERRRQCVPECLRSPDDWSPTSDPRERIEAPNELLPIPTGLWVKLDREHAQKLRHLANQLGCSVNEYARVILAKSLMRQVSDERVRRSPTT